MEQKEVAPVNYVHQNAIHCETIKKEQRYQKFERDYAVNPYKKTHLLAEKPHVYIDTENIEDKEEFIELYRRARNVPTAKYDYPQTEGQSYGWFTTPLLETDRSDIRLHHPRKMSEVTKYMAIAWKYKEQADNQATTEQNQ